MSYADPALIQTRNYLIGLGIPGDSIGIVGDESHQSSGGYHVGNDVLARIGKLTSDYSKRQTDKDRPGSNAAMALDIGGLSAQQLYELTAWLIAQCRAGTPDTRNIREIIGRRTPSGGVTRYDALGILPDSGSADHATHTHISYYRDSEGGDKTSLFRRYYEPAPTPQPSEEDDMNTLVYVRRDFPAGEPQLWALAGQAAAPGGWTETDDPKEANGWAAQFMKTGTSVDCKASNWEKRRAEHRGVSA